MKKPKMQPKEIPKVNTQTKKGYLVKKVAFHRKVRKRS